MLDVELEERLNLMGPNYKPLEKAAALKHIKNIEQIKVTHMSTAIVAKQIGELNDNQLEGMTKMCPIMVMDQYPMRDDGEGV